MVIIKSIYSSFFVIFAFRIYFYQSPPLLFLFYFVYTQNNSIYVRIIIASIANSVIRRHSKVMDYIIINSLFLSWIHYTYWLTHDDDAYFFPGWKELGKNMKIEGPRKIIIDSNSGVVTAPTHFTDVIQNTTQPFINGMGGPRPFPRQSGQHPKDRWRSTWIDCEKPIVRVTARISNCWQIVELRPKLCIIVFVVVRLKDIWVEDSNGV